MALRRPLASLLASAHKPTPSTAGPSFGQARAEKLQSRLSTAVRERRTLAGAAAATADPLSSTFDRRGDMVARKIDRLLSELKDEQA